MNFVLHGPAARLLAQQLLKSAALVLAVAVFLLMVSNTDWFTVPLVFATVTGAASIALGAWSVLARMIAAIHEWRRRS